MYMNNKQEKIHRGFWLFDKSFISYAGYIFIILFFMTSVSLK